MQHRFVQTSALAVIAAALLSACATDVTPPAAQYQVQAERMADGPPPLAGTPGETQGLTVVRDAVKIQPEESVGYQNLPTTVTQIYDQTPVELGLPDVVRMTLANERGLTIQGYDLKVAQYDIPVAKSIYDLMLSAGLRYDRIEQQNLALTVFQTPKTSARQITASAGLSQLLPTGAMLTLGYNAVRSSTLFTNFSASFQSQLATAVGYQQSLDLGISQPLLRGFGRDVTNAGIRIAQKEEEGAAADFQTNLEVTLANVLRTYWNLVGAVQIYKVREISYSAARDLLRVNTVKFNAGVLPQTDVLQAKAAAESRRADLITARQNVRDIEDDLKSLIFLQSGQPEWKAEIQPTQPIAWREVAIDQNDAIATALGQRSELRRAEANIAKSKINADVADNNRLPQLNIVGDVTPNSNERGFDRSTQTLAGGNYISYGIGLEFSYPLQNRAARYRYRQAIARRDQAQEVLRQLRDQITLQVRQAVRALRTARERIDATRSTVQSQEEKLRAETRRYEVGSSTAFEVLTFQNDLADSQSQYISAVIDYNIAALDLERARGTLLKTYGVQVVGSDLSPQHEEPIFPIGWN